MEGIEIARRADENAIQASSSDSLIYISLRKMKKKKNKESTLASYFYGSRTILRAYNNVESSTSLREYGQGFLIFHFIYIVRSRSLVFAFASSLHVSMECVG